GAGSGDLVEETRDQVTRPRPLTEAAEALLVDGDDDRGRGASLARRNLLVSVEPGMPHRTDHRHVFPQDGHEKESEQHQTVADAAPMEQGSQPPHAPLGHGVRCGFPDRARPALAQSSISIPSYAAETRSGRPVLEISS